MGDKHIKLFERALVEEQGDTFTGSKFALFVLLIDALLTAAHLGFISLFEKFLYFFFKCHI